MVNNILSRLFCIRDEILSSVTTWMSLAGLLLSKQSGTERQILHVLTYESYKADPEVESTVSRGWKGREEKGRGCRVQDGWVRGATSNGLWHRTVTMVDNNGVSK